MRMLLVAAGALLVNLSLFLLMENMISRDRVRVLDLFDAQTIEFVRTPIDDETRTKDRRKKPPPKPKEIRRPKAEVDDMVSRSELPADFNAYQVSSLLGEGGGVALGQRLVEGSGESMKMVMASDLTALARLPPQYPPTALAREQEGWVDLIFTVTTAGTVQDVVVVDSTPGTVFDTAAIAAVQRWRFRPVLVDGEPVSARAKVHIEFNLPEA